MWPRCRRRPAPVRWRTGRPSGCCTAAQLHVALAAGCFLGAVGRQLGVLAAADVGSRRASQQATFLAVFIQQRVEGRQLAVGVAQHQHVHALLLAVGYFAGVLVDQAVARGRQHLEAVGNYLLQAVRVAAQIARVLDPALLLGLQLGLAGGIEGLACGGFGLGQLAFLLQQGGVVADQGLHRRCRIGAGDAAAGGRCRSAGRLAVGVGLSGGCCRRRGLGIAGKRGAGGQQGHAAQGHQRLDGSDHTFTAALHVCPLMSASWRMACGRRGHGSKIVASGFLGLCDRARGSGWRVPERRTGARRSPSVCIRCWGQGPFLRKGIRPRARHQ